MDTYIAYMILVLIISSVSVVSGYVFGRRQYGTQLATMRIVHKAAVRYCRVRINQIDVPGLEAILDGRDPE